MKLVVKRPVILTIICVVGILWSLLNFIIVFSPSIRKIGEFAPAVFGIIVACQFVSFIGVWNMKRWGVMMYFLSFFFKQAFTLMLDRMGMWQIVGIVLSIVFTIFFLIFYKRMEDEL